MVTIAAKHCPAPPPTLADSIAGTAPLAWGRAAGAVLAPGGWPTVRDSIERFRSDLASCPVVVADEVAADFYQSEREYWDFRTLGPIATDRPRLFVEWAGPDRFRSRGGWVDVGSSRDAVRFGVMLDFSDVADLGPCPGLPLAGGGTLDLSNFEAARWSVNAVHFAAKQGRPLWPGVAHVFGVDAGGKVVTGPLSLGLGGLRHRNFRSTAIGLGEGMVPALLAIKATA